MKKILLGTTAIAAAALYAQSAQAQITVSLGGYTEFFGAYYDDDAPNRTDHEFQLETEIVVRADGKADNGLLYGAKVEFQNSTGGTDEDFRRRYRRSVRLSVRYLGPSGTRRLRRRRRYPGDLCSAGRHRADRRRRLRLPRRNTIPAPALVAGFRFGGLPNGTLVKAPDSATPPRSCTSPRASPVSRLAPAMRRRTAAKRRMLSASRQRWRV